MRRMFTLACLFIFLFAFEKVYAEEGSNVVCPSEANVTIGFSPVPVVAVRNALTIFKQERLHDDNYCIIFPNTTIDVQSELNIFALDVAELLSGHGEHNVYLRGLRLRVTGDFTSPLLSITNNQTSKLYINNLNMTDAISGLLLSGTGAIELTNSELTCSSQSGIGIDIHSNGARVKGTEVSGCGEGVRIAASRVLVGADSAEEYKSDKNIIHGNKIGIFVHGENARFPFNMIDNNTIAGIDMAQALLAQYGRPVIEFVDESKKMALHCEKEADSPIVKSRWIQFKNIMNGDMIIYKTDITNDIFQGKEYITKCSIDSTGKCLLGFPVALQVDNSQCGVNIRAVGLFDTPAYSTMYTTEKFLLDGPISTISIITTTGPPVSVPGVAGGGDTSDSVADELESSELPEDARRVYFDPPAEGADGAARSSAEGGAAAGSGNASVKAACGLVWQGTYGAWKLGLLLILMPVAVFKYFRFHFRQS